MSEDPEIRYEVISEEMSMEDLAFRIWEEHQIVWYNDLDVVCKRTWFTGTKQNAIAHADHELARLYGRYYQYIGYDEDSF